MRVELSGSELSWAKDLLPPLLSLRLWRDVRMKAGQVMDAAEWIGGCEHLRCEKVCHGKVKTAANIKTHD